MATTPSYQTTRPAKVGLVWFIPIYSPALGGAYILASIAFPQTIEKVKIFGILLSYEKSFNQPLFTHLTTGLVLIVFVHLLGRLMSVRISTGNAILAFLLMISIFSFILGINIPLFHTTKFWIIKEHLSLIQVLENLNMKGEFQLYYVMMIFTFFIPSLKMMVMAYDIFLSKSDGRRYLLLSLLAKWAMLDVLIVGVIVSSLKSGTGFAEMTMGEGLSFFIISIILSLIISSCLPYTRNY